MPLLDVHHASLTVFGYPLSALELAGTVLNALGVWLMVRRSAWTWPVGLVAVSLFAALFYQLRLYSDLIEQAYYFATSWWGWWLWTRRGATDEQGRAAVGRGTPAQNAAVGLATVAATGLLGTVALRLPALWPAAFPEPPSYPWWDALTTAMGFSAQWLAARRRIENWALWLAADAISLAIYHAKGVRLVEGLYVLFLALAAKGWIEWRREAATAPSR